MRSPLLLLLLLLAASAYGASAHEVGCTFCPETSNFAYVDTKKFFDYLEGSGITHVRLLQSMADDLSQFADHDISVSIAAATDLDIDAIANSTYSATRWLTGHGITSETSQHVDFVHICLGYDSVVNDHDNTVLAMANLRAALDSIGLHHVQVTTEQSFFTIVNTAFPPTEASFKPEVQAKLKVFLDFLNKTGAPFLVEIHPYELYLQGLVPSASIRHALFEIEPDSLTGLLDEGSGLRYGNMFDMMVDSVVVSLVRMGYPDMAVEVSATGWPKFDEGQIVVEETALNAAEYYGRLAMLLKNRRGTPLWPERSIRTYLHSLARDYVYYPLSYRKYKETMDLASTSFQEVFELRADGGYMW